ncbi:4Fe-4S binding protein [Vannielia litorea]|uniref:4Fe-4S binding protein n=1 Tax=Vannielia litorea TaxID=1217970 RepID=UPI001BCE0148|nr:4Fe-4S binding protein [Vannielia litorea]MBS8225140.1 4Fe-4S binding protein [Vannielia litorea]
MGGSAALRAVALLLAAVITAVAARAEPLARDEIVAMVAPPMELGEQLNDKGVWQLLNSGGAEAGYVFETEPMAPLPGFSGAPINMLVVLDLEGTYLDVRLISHNEPIFVSGLGEAPFRKFFEQYRGLSISDTLVVGTPYGEGSDGSALVYLDGVTKATASVRIAHESLLAAVHQVAREKMQGVAAAPAGYPDPSVQEDLSWDDLMAEGLVTRLTVTNSEVDAAFAGTIWATDDPEAQANPDGIYLDLWLVDLGPPSVAAAVLDESSQAALAEFLTISDNDEPILVVDTGRHGLVSEEFVRNTAPDWLSATQDGLPVALRDSDLFFSLAEDVPEEVKDGAQMILRTDRRVGFDPSRPWQMEVKSTRAHGVFRPEIGSQTLVAEVTPVERFFTRPTPPVQRSPFRIAVDNRLTDLALLGAFLAALFFLLGPGMRRFAGWRWFTPARLAILALVTGFIGWWGQGQLSIVTVLGVIRTAWEGGSYVFLAYDPFGLAVWAAAILGFFFWGRGLFCGWLCPFGALQEFAAHLGRALRLPQIEPSARWDARLKWLKYAVLAGLVTLVFLAPAHVETAAEVEPFKTAITTFFLREWYYVAYAVGLLLLSMVLFKGFCRYLCPLGAVMAIGGLLRRRDWIARRAECGSPCQLCRVKCRYGSIKKSGAIDYSECFQCLDCVAIHDDPAQCVPLVLAGRAGKRGEFKLPKGVPAK